MIIGGASTKQTGCLISLIVFKLDCVVCQGLLDFIFSEAPFNNVVRLESLCCLLVCLAWPSSGVLSINMKPSDHEAQDKAVVMFIKLTFVTLVTKVAVIRFKRPAERVARIGIRCGCCVKHTVHYF